MKKKVLGFLLVLLLLGALQNIVMAKASIGIFPEFFDMYTGETARMKIKIVDSKYEISDFRNVRLVSSGVTWSSSNKSVASVNKNSGLVKAKKPGKCTIIGKYNGHKYKRKLNIRESFISNTYWEMGVGEEMVLYLNGSMTKANWNSTAPSVCSVNKHGQLKAKKPGTCYIKVKYNKKKFRCKVVVKGTAEISVYLHNKDIDGLKQVIPRLKTETKSGYEQYLCRRNTDSAISGDNPETVVDFDVGIPNDHKTGIEISCSYDNVSLYGIKYLMTYQEVSQKLKALSYEPEGGAILKQYYFQWGSMRFFCEDIEFYLHGNGEKPDEIFTCHFVDKKLNDYEWRMGKFN